MTLLEAQALFARMVPSLITKGFELGYEVVLGEAWRTPEQAKWNAQHGTGIVNSVHCKRLAIDLILFLEGRWQQDTESYRPLGEWWTQQHKLARWGGDFHSRPDGGHFSFEWEGVQ